MKGTSEGLLPGYRYGSVISTPLTLTLPLPSLSTTSPGVPITRLTRKFEEVSGRIPAKDRTSLSGLLVFWVEGIQP